MSAPGSGAAGKAKRAVGKGLAKFAGKRTHNPVVQHANDDEEGEDAQWSGGGDATFDDEDDVEMMQVSTQPTMTDTV